MKTPIVTVADSVFVFFPVFVLKGFKNRTNDFTWSSFKAVRIKVIWGKGGGLNFENGIATLLVN